jgi:P27 family predicted phage terminase small subunit
MPGRKPKPAPLKKLEGTDRKDRRNVNAPELPVAIPLMPEWLSDQAKEAYQELSILLTDMRVLTKADRKALEMLCDAYSEYREAREIIRTEGMTYETTNKEGDVMHRARPEVAIASDAFKRVKTMLGEFGLTPATRSKVNALPEDKQSKVRSLVANI